MNFIGDAGALATKQQDVVRLESKGVQWLRTLGREEYEAMTRCCN